MWRLHYPTQWTYITYQMVTMCMPLAVLIIVFCIEAVDKTIPICPMFFSMIRVRRRRIYCFGVDITASAEGAIVKRCMKFILRITGFVVCAYLWQSIILESIIVHNTINVIKQDRCNKAWDCFQFDSVENYFDNPTGLLYQGWNICSAVPKQERAGNVWALCYRFYRPRFTTIITSLGSSTALCALIIISYEVLVWVMLWDSTDYEVFLISCRGLAAITFCGTIAVFSANLLDHLSTWIPEFCLFSVPFTLYKASVTAAALRTRRRNYFEFRHLLKSGWLPGKEKDNSAGLVYGKCSPLCKLWNKRKHLEPLNRQRKLSKMSNCINEQYNTVDDSMYYSNWTKHSVSSVDFFGSQHKCAGVSSMRKPVQYVEDLSPLTAVRSTNSEICDLSSPLKKNSSFENNDSVPAVISGTTTTTTTMPDRTRNLTYSSRQSSSR